VKIINVKDIDILKLISKVTLPEITQIGAVLVQIAWKQWTQ